MASSAQIPTTETPADLIARLQGLIHECLRDEVPDGPFAIVDLPDIRNPGDSAIWLSPMAYLARHHGRRPASSRKTGSQRPPSDRNISWT
ncbi:hypothetical protein [Methylobrevis albus]|uniref:Uncharacterized protein n=1 Tax=Methylobrevis albus TaxID=2793297 RepID=A0A931I279_9HYPH|nr:hypothetical protein [Methylobrevis albus]MBH0238907.1 hypothetical protein [Methylobrevis albus]